MKRRILCLVHFATATTAMGCGILLGAPPAAPGTETGPEYHVPQESKDALRQGEAAAERAQEQMLGSQRMQMDRAEQDLVKALNLALGKQAVTPGMPPPESSSTVLKALRQTNIKLSVAPVLDQDGHPVNDNFIQLKDSYTERVQQLSRKIAEQKATKAEMKEVQDGAKYVMKLNDLRMQILNLSTATMTTNAQVQSAAMMTMLRVANMVRSRKMMEMEMNAEDYGRVKKWLEDQQRMEAIAATSMAVLAIYQAVINKNGDPKALDVMCENAVQAFPFKPSVTDDAKNYIANLKGNVTQVKAQYEGMMRKTHGDKKYEQMYKAGIDSMFRQAEQAENQKSASQMASDVNKQYQEDLAKCARGEEISPSSMVSPVKCKEVRSTGNVSAPTASGSASNDGGGLFGSLGSLTDMVPGLSAVKASLEGVQALAKGDPKAALNAAVGLVPGGGPLKQGLSMATKLLKFT